MSTRIVYIAAIMSTALPASAFAFGLEAKLKCTGDAYRLCSSVIPNVEKITACMRQQRESLSAACRDVMERDEAAAVLKNSDTNAQGTASHR